MTSTKEHTDSLQGASRFLVVPPWGATLVLVALVLLIARTMGLGGATVFADEYSYGAWTRSLFDGLPQPALAPKLDNWLFLRVFEWAHYGQANALVAARLINAALCALSAVVVFRLVAPWIGARCGALLGLAYSVLFSGAWVGFFMPEASQAAATALVALTFARFAMAPSVPRLLLVAVAGAAASLLKSHGLLLMPALALAAIFARETSHQWGWRRALGHAALLALTWVLAVLVIKGVLGGGWSINLLGDFYTGVISSSATRVSLNLAPYMTLAKAHFSTLMLVAGVPLMFAMASVFRLLLRRSGSDRALDVLNLALMCGFGGMLLVSIVFTVSVAGAGPHETLTRIHGRYYEHLMLLAAIGGAMVAPGLLQRIAPRFRWGLLAAGIVLVFLAYRATADLGWQNANDFAAAFALQASPVGRWYGAALALLVLVSALLVPRRSHWALAFGLSAWLLMDAVVMERYRYESAAHAVDRAGEVIARAEADGDRAQVLIVSSGHTADLYRAAFHLLQEDASVWIGESKDCGAAAQGKRWVLVLDANGGACGFTPAASFENIVVAKTKDQP